MEFEHLSLSLLPKICPKLPTFCLDITSCDEIGDYIVAYLREHAMGDEQKEMQLSVKVEDAADDSLEQIAETLIGRVTTEVACDVAERDEESNKISFRKRNAVLNIELHHLKNEEWWSHSL